MDSRLKRSGMTEYYRILMYPLTLTLSHKQGRGDLNKAKANPLLPIWTLATFNQKLIYFGAFVVMASECLLVRIRSFSKEGINAKEEIAALLRGFYLAGSSHGTLT